jgi:hypothetical protein
MRISGPPQDLLHQKYDGQYANDKTKTVASDRRIFDLLGQETNFVYGQVFNMFSGFLLHCAL